MNQNTNKLPLVCGLILLISTQLTIFIHINLGHQSQYGNSSASTTYEIWQRHMVHHEANQHSIKILIYLLRIKFHWKLLQIQMSLMEAAINGFKTNMEQVSLLLNGNPEFGQNFSSTSSSPDLTPRSTYRMFTSAH